MENNEFNLRVSQLVGEIMQLGTLITLETEIVVNINFSAHVKKFEVIISPNEEEFLKHHNSEENIFSGDLNFRITQYRNATIEQKNFTIKRLLKIKRQLISILKEKQINYGTLDYTIETVEYKRYVI